MFLRSMSLYYTIFYHMLEGSCSTDVSGLNIIWSLRLTEKALDRNTLCAFFIAGQPLRPGSHQLSSCEKNSVERFSWIGFVTLVWSLLESKKRSSLLDRSIHTGCKVFHFSSQELRMLSRSLSDCKSLLLNVMIQVSQFIRHGQLCH